MPSWDIFAGFSLNSINNAVRISEAAIAGDILLFSLGGQVGDYTGAHTVIFRGVFSMKWGARAGDIIFLGCRIA